MKTNLITSLFLLLGAGGIASGDTILNFVSPGPVVAGDAFTVDITADSDAIAAYQFDVDFDPTILNADDAVGLGDFAGLFLYSSIDNVGGVISSIFGSTSGGQIDTGTGIPLAELTFTAIAPGDVTLSFANYTIVSDPNSFATDPNVTANTLDVTVTPEPAAWTMLLTAGAALFAALRIRRSGERSN